jgi:hypothetical protein
MTKQRATSRTTICIVLSFTCMLNAQSGTVLKEGEEVNLKFSQPVSSKTAQTDDTVELALAEDLKVGDVVVAKAGTKAVGTVTNAHKAGMMGKGGELNVRLDYLKADAGRIHLRGSRGREGDGKVGAVVALTVLFGPIGLIKKGKDIEVKEGTPLKVFVAEDFPLKP